MFDLCHNGWAVVWVLHSLASKGNPNFAKGAVHARLRRDELLHHHADP